VIGPAVLDAIDGATGKDVEEESPEARIESALRDGFRAEGLLGSLQARSTAERFVAGVPFRADGFTDEEIAEELGCSAKTIARDRAHVARLAGGSELLQQRLLGGVTDDADGH